VSPALDTLLTPRLDLVAATPELLRAEHADPAALATLLDVRMPSRWPPEYYDLDDVERYLARATESPDGVLWGLRYVIARTVAPNAVRALVGVAGFGSPPRANGGVEIGYAIVPEARGNGYATEAATALVAYAFADPRVNAVEAETLPDLPDSIRVLEKSGFSRLPGRTGERVLRFVRTLRR
jgi:[ribosomal protein S5]-alanine N-acetyltransferase